VAAIRSRIWNNSSATVTTGQEFVFRLVFYQKEKETEPEPEPELPVPEENVFFLFIWAKNPDSQRRLPPLAHSDGIRCTETYSGRALYPIPLFV
jgi:hypothetical protein